MGERVTTSGKPIGRDPGPALPLTCQDALPLDGDRLSQASQHAVIVLDDGGTVKSWNDAATRLFGWLEAEIVGRHLDVIFTQGDRETAVLASEMARATAEGCSDDTGWLVHKNGERFWASGVLLPLAGKASGDFVKIVRERGEAKRADDALRESERRHRLVAETVPQLLWRSRTDGFWDWASPQWTLFTGQAQTDSLGSGWLEMVHPDDRQETEHRWDVATARGEEFNLEHRLQGIDEKYYWFKTRAVPLLEVSSPERGILHWFGTSTDIHAIREAQERSLFLALHDDLTGAANRALLRRTLDQAAGARTTFFVLYIDIDKFKECNDRAGHRGGDLALREIAERLRSELRASDLLARVGGDEFVVVRENDTSRRIEEFARRLVQVIARPIFVEDHVFHASASVGIALYPEDGPDLDELLRRADIAMTRAKLDGGDRASRFDATMDQAANERRHLLRELDDALEKDAFYLVYQPFFSLGNGQVTGFEALARWEHATRGAIPPSTFIPLAESSGRIGRLGLMLLEKACHEAAAWSRSWVVAINLSPRQFRDRNLVRLIESILAQSGLAPGRLELEVTESFLIDDPDDVLAQLLALKELGIRIALDDFGIGYSNLNYLRQFPFDKVKIDRQFVQSIREDDVSETIVSAVVAIGNSLHSTVTAEGIETERQLELVRALGCDQAQGFLLGLPDVEPDVRYGRGGTRTMPRRSPASR